MYLILCTNVQTILCTYDIFIIQNILELPTKSLEECIHDVHFGSIKRLYVYTLQNKILNVKKIMYVKTSWYTTYKVLFSGA